MASVVEICNLALSHLGDKATVASIDPPEGSAQAEHCARFYPIARDGLLEMHNWSFSLRRVTGADLGSEWSNWRYAYAMPADALAIVSVLPANATDDYNGYGTAYGTSYCEEFLPRACYITRPYTIETNSSGERIILTNEPDALIRYKAQVEDTTKFSPLFTLALSHMLASMLAGPVIKGDAGAAESKRQLQLMASYLSSASNSDSNQRDGGPQHVVPWMASR